MRHGKAGFKLGRVTAHRWALFRNLLVALFRHERIMTTEAKAKAVRGLADHMVTLAKREDLHARRQVLSMVPDAVVVKKLFDTIAARFSERHGGYTRIMKAGLRPGDRAQMVVLELVDRPEAPKEKGKKDAKAEKAPPKEDKKDRKAGKGEAGAGAAKGRRKKAAAAAG
jgi:large subunit ribosomal protein L17